MNWIDVNEKLPTKPGDYLVTTQNGFVCVGKFWVGMGENVWSGRLKNCVVAWCELPKPYVRGKQ